jgi:hypothetical protein
MNVQALENQLRRKICAQITLVQEGINRYIVHQPFHFDDGDHFVVILKAVPEGWIFTDEGHTLMHVQYEDIDLSRGTRAVILDATLRSFSVENQDGELLSHVQEEMFADTLFSFLQALVKITDLDFLTKERARSTFLDDAQSLIQDLVPQDRLTFGYHDPEHDPDQNYKVDCRINGTFKPNFVFFINSDFRCQNATIVCHQFERWGLPFRAAGVFENQSEINRIAVAQFSDVAYKQIPSLGSRDRLKSYFDEVLSLHG